MLRLYYLRGDQLGGEWSFESSVHEVRIGRDSQACQVALPPDELHVSRQHCALRLVLGRYRLVLNQENPVYLNGKPCFEGQVLEPRCVLRIGKDGPKLRVMIEASEVLPSTLMLEKTLQEHPEAMAERVIAPVRRQRLWIGAAIAVLAGASAFAIYQGSAASSAIAALVERQPSVEEQNKIRQLIAPESRPQDFATTLQNAQASVYMVLLDGIGARSPIGTAWVVDRKRGLLATCAHVAHGSPAASLLVRSSGENPVDIKIRSVELHPGYERFQALRLRYALPSSVSPGHNTGSLIPADDVGLLEVAEDARSSLGPDLPLASEQRCGDIAHGLQIASIGYPLEGISGNYERPVARSQYGHVLAVSDFLLGRASSPNSCLLHVSLPVAGGASGSPVFDSSGSVIGVVSAGSFVFLEQQIRTGDQSAPHEETRTTRVPTGIVNYAQRIDVLKEVLGGVGNQAIARKEPIWKRDMERVREEGEREIVTTLVGQFSDLLEEQVGTPPKTKEILDRKKAFLTALVSPCSKSFELVAKEAGFYLVIASAVEDVDIDVTARIGKEPQRVDGQVGSRAFVLLPQSKGGRLDVTVYMKTPPSEPVPFELVVVRFAF